MKSLEAGEIDPNNKWHYALPLTAHEIEFLKHTPTGWSAWDNRKAYQPKNKYNTGRYYFRPGKSSESQKII